MSDVSPSADAAQRPDNNVRSLAGATFLCLPTSAGTFESREPRSSLWCPQGMAASTIVQRMLRAIICGGVLCSIILGQGEESKLEFEVASVHPSAPGGPISFGVWRGGPGTADPGRIVYSRVPLQSILLNAFELPLDQLTGPGWIASEPFDIAANVPGGATKAQTDVMLQNLLIERFHLTFHRLGKEFPAYELRVAKGGLKLKESASAGASLEAPPESYRITAAKDGFPTLPPGVRQGVLKVAGRTRARFRDYSLTEFAQWLRPKLGTLVPGPGVDSAITEPARITDKTGLTGKYDFTLEYAGAGMAAEALPPEARDKLDLNGPSIFTALEKQLGLTLQKTNVKLDVLVIDHIDRVPTAD